MSTGPVEVSKSVLDAQLATMLTPHHESFWRLHDETCAALGRVLKTKSRIVMMHGSIRSGIDVALGNFVRAGTKVLAIENGFWGRLIGDWAERRGAFVTRVVSDLITPIDSESVAAALEKDAYDLVTLVHVETNTGIVNPVESIGRIVTASDALFFVDGACSIGAMPYETDAWGIDISTTGSHKCLNSVPGLAIISISEKAWKRLPNSGHMGSYFDLRSWWRATIERAEVPPFTQPTTLVYALREALKELEVFGIEDWWQEHRKVADNVMTEMRNAGFSFLLDRGPAAGARESYSDTVLAVEYPEAVSDSIFRDLLMDDFGLFVIGNIGEFASRSFRIGLMSPPQLDPANLSFALKSFKTALQSPKVRAS
jgi:alanine-glyoxylate transaminase/serine-glyoxylate transaminase/serine-pyruvate transaminase